MMYDVFSLPFFAALSVMKVGKGKKNFHMPWVWPLAFLSLLMKHKLEARRVDSPMAASSRAEHRP